MDQVIQAPKVCSHFAEPSSRSCYQKETSIVVQKEGDGFGLTIRGGPRPGESGRAPYVITRIRPGSPADRYVRLQNNYVESCMCRIK